MTTQKILKIIETIVDNYINNFLDEKYNWDSPIRFDKKLPKILYHTNNPYDRFFILHRGLVPTVGDSYISHAQSEVPEFYDLEDDEIENRLMPVIFLKKKNDYDSTYDDDRWLIDTSYLDPNCLYYDFDDYMSKSGCLIYTKPIPPEACKLIYKGKECKPEKKLEKDWLS